MSDQQFKPISSNDVTDLALLPKRFGLFVAEMRDSVKLLSERQMQAILRVEAKLDDLNHHVAKLDRELHGVIQRVSALEKRIPARTARKKKET